MIILISKWKRCKYVISSGVADIKTGWLSQSWPCLEPVHFSQKDDYNCGVIICLVSTAINSLPWRLLISLKIYYLRETLMWLMWPTNYFSSNGILLRRHSRVSSVFHYQRVPAPCRWISTPIGSLPSSCQKDLYFVQSTASAVSTRHKHKHKYKHKHGNKHRKQNLASFCYAITLNANFPMQNFLTSDICLFVVPYTFSEIDQFIQPLTLNLLLCFMWP